VIEFNGSHQELEKSKTLVDEEKAEEYKYWNKKIIKREEEINTFITEMSQANFTKDVLNFSE